MSDRLIKCVSSCPFGCYDQVKGCVPESSAMVPQTLVPQEVIPCESNGQPYNSKASVHVTSFSDGWASRVGLVGKFARLSFGYAFAPW